MSLFGPNYRGLLKKAPPRFGEIMQSLEPELTAKLAENGVRGSTATAVREILYPQALLAYSRVADGVSADCIREADRLFKSWDYYFRAEQRRLHASVRDFSDQVCGTVEALARETPPAA